MLLAAWIRNLSRIMPKPRPSCGFEPCMRMGLRLQSEHREHMYKNALLPNFSHLRTEVGAAAYGARGRVGFTRLSAVRVPAITQSELERAPIPEPATRQTKM
jgi:hypothetical protein